MTAEAIVMNKTAVALAADSAVTISSGRGGIKTYETINKLFELIRGSNVGLMIYSNAELNRIPWETIVKTYRRERSGFIAPHLEDYVDDFSSFLAGSNALIPQDSDTSFVVQTTYDQLLKLFKFIVDNKANWISGSGRVVKSRLLAVLREALNTMESSLVESEDAPWAEALPEKQLELEYGAAIDSLVSELFGEFEITKADSNRIRQFSLSALRKCVSEPGETGLVIAGFGTEDYLPKLYSSLVRGRVSKVLRVAHPSLKNITIDAPGHFQTFAQDEQAMGFLSGISSEVRSAVVQYWSEWVENVATRAAHEIRAEIPKLDEATISRVSAELHKVAHEGLSQFGDEMSRREYSLYIRPTLDSIASLPKDELGLLAESLVNITSLKQRMSIFDYQTVGGPIDVALISLGDGFVWLRRKHYFSPELNPSWHLTHQGTINSRGSNPGGSDGDRQA
jgi:hypothetical protein